MKTYTKNLEGDIARAIDEALKERISLAFDKYIEEFNKEAQQIKSDVIANAVLRLSNYYSFQDMGNTLRIEVRNPKDKD